MQTLQITRIVLSPTPAGNTLCTVWYRTATDPNPVIISSGVSVPPNGFLSPPLEFGVPDGVEPFVDAVANCGGTPYEEQINTTTTTTAATTTTTTAGTTTTTTTAATTTTTTAGTTTTTTTTTAGHDLHVTKDVAADNVTINVDGTDYVSAPGESNHTWLGVFPGSSVYAITVTVVPSGRPNAPIDLSDNAAIDSCSGCTTVGGNHNGSNGDVTVTVGV